MKRWNFLFLLSPLLPLLLLLGRSNEAFLTRDVSLAYLPAKRYWVDSFLKFHTVPGWNPLSYGGIPFRADLNLSPLHPLNFLFLLFPQAIDRGYLLFIAAHLLLLGAGTYLLFRRLRFGERGALLASLSLILSGVSFSTMNLMNVAASFASLPFFCFFLLALRKRFRWLDLAGMSIAWAWPIYSGDPQFSYWMAIAAFGIVAERCAWERSLRPLARTFGAGLLALGLSAAQLLPSLALASASERGLGSLTLSVAERFSFHPLRLLELFLPMPFGTPGTGEQQWAGRLTEAVFTMPFLLHVYVGVVGGGFFLWQLRRVLRARRPSRRNAIYASLLLVLLVAALGQYSFLNVYGLFFYALLGWKLFRYPERLLLLVTLILFIWNGPLFRLLAHKLAAPAGANSRRALQAAGALMIAAAVFLGLYGCLRILEIHTLARSFLHVCLAAALFCLLWFLRGRFVFFRKYGFSLFCLLLVFDALPFGFDLLWRTSSTEVQFRTNEFAEKIHKHIDGRREQISLGAASRYFHGTYSGPFPTSSNKPLQIGQAWDWGVMYPNVPMYFGIASAAGYSPFDPKEILGLWEKYGRRDPERLLNLFSVAYYPLETSPGKPTLQFNPEALPYAWFPEGVIFLPEAAGREASLFLPSFEYKKNAVIAGEGAPWRRGGEDWKILSYSRSPDHLKVNVKPLSPDAYFVWNERRNSNWAAYFNGRPVAISEANSWAMSVKLDSAGAESGTIEFIYEDKIAELGNWITALTLALLAIGTGGTLLPFYRRKQG